MPNGARLVNGNWVIPNELGNEIGNDMRKARQLIAIKNCMVLSGILRKLSGPDPVSGSKKGHNKGT